MDNEWNTPIDVDYVKTRSIVNTIINKSELKGGKLDEALQFTKTTIDEDTFKTIVNELSKIPTNSNFLLATRNKFKTYSDYTTLNPLDCVIFQLTIAIMREVKGRNNMIKEWVKYFKSNLEAYSCDDIIANAIQAVTNIIEDSKLTDLQLELVTLLPLNIFEVQMTMIERIKENDQEGRSNVENMQVFFDGIDTFEKYISAPNFDKAMFLIVVAQIIDCASIEKTTFKLLTVKFVTCAMLNEADVIEKIALTREEFGL